MGAGTFMSIAYLSTRCHSYSVYLGKGCKLLVYELTASMSKALYNLLDLTFGNPKRGKIETYFLTNYCY